jgi:signal transduction histidine kinase
VSPRAAAFIALAVAGELLLVALVAAGIEPFEWAGVPGAFGALIAIVVAIRFHPVVGMAVAAVGGGAFGWVVARPWYEDMVPAVIWMISAGAAGHAAHAARRRIERAESARWQAVATVLRSEQQQRRVLAAELHDDTIQVLTAAIMRLDAARLASPEVMARHVDAARATIHDALERTRRLTFELRPPLLDEQGLRAALCDLAHETCREADCEPSCDVSEVRLDPETEELVYRVVREALLNVRKHACARRVWVQVDCNGGAIVGAVRDDGRGFDPTAAGSGELRRLHLGLSAAEERVRLAGGQLWIDARPGKGTTVRFTVPARPREAPAAA